MRTLACLLIVVACSCAAQSDSGPSLAPDWTLGLAGTWIPAADVEGADAEVTTLRYEAGVEYQGFSFEYAHTAYDWKKADISPFTGAVADGDPWSGIHEFRLGYETPRRFDRTWSTFFLGGVSSAFESQIDDSFGAYAFGALSYRAGQDWWLTAGIFGNVDAVRVRVLPGIAASWRDPRAPGWSAALGFPMARLSYRVHPGLAAGVGLGMRPGRAARLADDSEVLPGGYLEDEGFHGSLFVETALSRRIEVRIETLYPFQRELTFYDGDGDERISRDVDDTFGLRVAMTARY